MTDRSRLPDLRRSIRVAAVQTPAAPNVPAGLERATPLVARAAAEGAQLVLLPELMATHYVFTADMWDSAEPDQGPTVRWLRDTAQGLGIWLGTSYLQASGDDFFNTFVLAGPSGEEAGRVRKQTPAMYEPCFFRGEPGPHLIDTELGRIGVGICNDNHRSYMPALLQQGGADLLLMPHCWPLPTRPARCGERPRPTALARDPDRLGPSLRNLSGDSCNIRQQGGAVRLIGAGPMAARRNRHDLPRPCHHRRLRWQRRGADAGRRRSAHRNGHAGPEPQTVRATADLRPICLSSRPGWPPDARPSVAVRARVRTQPGATTAGAHGLWCSEQPNDTPSWALALLTVPVLLATSCSMRVFDLL